VQNRPRLLAQKVFIARGVHVLRKGKSHIETNVLFMDNLRPAAGRHFFATRRGLLSHGNITPR
jgi:hypothetical protein